MTREKRKQHEQRYDERKQNSIIILWHGGHHVIRTVIHNKEQYSRSAVHVLLFIG